MERKLSSIPMGNKEKFYSCFELDCCKYIYVIGGGGKSSLIRSLEDAFLEHGKTVISSTTTKIRVPKDNREPELMLCQDLQKLEGHPKFQYEPPWKTVLARTLSEDGTKLLGYEANQLDRLWEKNPAHSLLVEGDGSASRSIKAYQPREPVLSKKADLVIVVIGIDILGKPLNDTFVHRAELARAWLNKDAEHTVQMDDVVNLIFHGEGCLRSVSSKSRLTFFLNKVHTDFERQQAKTLADKIINRWRKQERQDNREPTCILGSLLPSPIVEHAR